MINKRFTIPAPAWPLAASRISGCVGCVNRRKFGRHRRGTVLLVGAAFFRKGDDTMECLLQFLPGSSSRMHVRGQWFQVYKVADFRWLLRRLRKEEAA